MNCYLKAIPLIVVVVLLSMMTGAGVSHATFISSQDWKTTGDGLLTYDSNTNREWLDLTVNKESIVGVR